MTDISPTVVTLPTLVIATIPALNPSPNLIARLYALGVVTTGASHCVGV